MIFRPMLLLLKMMIVLGLISTVAHSAEVTTDPALLQAKVWDQPIVLGPGAYRSGRITPKNDAKHTIQPGALVEKSSFNAAGAAHWLIDGALLREVKFGGDLGTHFLAKNSAFEECFFYKNGGWFVQWAGTKWRFENCVFTRSFMPAGFGVHDYSVSAVSCTFVGIKMPTFGLKKNPSEGVQGKDLQFVRCRFVGCDIPETTLALTVDCTFENCQFNPKKHDWEAAEPPVTVSAYVPVGRAPASYVNGKLTVNFTAGPPPQPTGTTVQHTLAGPRILLPWAQQVRTYTELGTADKAASEIPVFAKTTPLTPVALPSNAPVPSLPVAPPPTSEPAAPPVMGKNRFFNLPDDAPVPAQPPQPSLPPQAPLPPPAPSVPVATAAATPAAPVGKELRSMDELLVAVPLQQELVVQGRVNPAALEAVNASVDQASAGKGIALRFTVEEVAAHRKDGYAFRVRGQPQPMSLRGQAITGRVEALFRQDESAALSRIRKSSVVVVRGVVSKAELTGSGRTVNFNVTVADAKVQ
jgi:hypothetical protein